MKKYIYMIEVQKPTGTHRFLKVLDEVLVVNFEEVKDFSQKIFDDRVENYTYLGYIEKEDWPELLNYFYCLVRKYDESLEYTRDDYVYLIPKKGREPGIRIGHRLPHKLTYPQVKPIPFYPEKKKEEEIDTRCKCADVDFFEEKFYRLFFKKVNELMAFYRGFRSFSYINFEAFVLTYGKFYATIRNKEVFFNLMRLTDEPANLYEIRLDYAADETYEVYIKPTAEGEVFNLLYGEFYVAKSKVELVELYTKFIAAAEEWKISQLT